MNSADDRDPVRWQLGASKVTVAEFVIVRTLHPPAQFRSTLMAVSNDVTMADFATKSDGPTSVCNLGKLVLQRRVNRPLTQWRPS